MHQRPGFRFVPSAFGVPYGPSLMNLGTALRCHIVRRVGQLTARTAGARSMALATHLYSPDRPWRSTVIPRAHVLSRVITGSKRPHHCGRRPFMSLFLQKCRSPPQLGKHALNWASTFSTAMIAPAWSPLVRSTSSRKPSRSSRMIRPSFSKSS